MRSSGPLRWRAGGAAAMAAATLVTALLGLALTRETGHIAVFWPANGLIVGASAAPAGRAPAGRHSRHLPARQSRRLPARRRCLRAGRRVRRAATCSRCCSPPSSPQRLDRPELDPRRSRPAVRPAAARPSSPPRSAGRSPPCCSARPTAARPRRLWLQLVGQPSRSACCSSCRSSPRSTHGRSSACSLARATGSCSSSALELAAAFGLLGGILWLILDAESMPRRRCSRRSWSGWRCASAPAA